MILQYSNGITECYEEAQSISIGTIDIKEGWTPADAISYINQKLKDVWGHVAVEFRTDKIILEKSNQVKFAIINTERFKEKLLLFNGYTTLYLLNDKGKTIKIF